MSEICLSRRQLLPEAAIALFVATFVFTAQIGSLLTPHNSFNMIWQTSDGLAMVATILLVAAILWSVSAIALWKQWDWLRRGYEVSLMLLIADGLIALPSAGQLTGPRIHNAALAAFMASLLVIGIQIARPQFWFARFTRTMCLIFSPFPIIVFFVLLTNQTWGPQREAKPTADQWSAAAKPQAHPVLFVIFDGWSWQQSTEDGRFLPNLEHANRLATNAVYFQHALSPATTTTYWASVTTLRSLKCQYIKVTL